MTSQDAAIKTKDAVIGDLLHVCRELAYLEKKYKMKLMKHSIALSGLLIDMHDDYVLIKQRIDRITRNEK